MHEKHRWCKRQQEEEGRTILDTSTDVTVVLFLYKNVPGWFQIKCIFLVHARLSYSECLKTVCDIIDKVLGLRLTYLYQLYRQRNATAD